MASSTPSAHRAVNVTVRVGLLKILGIELDVAGAIRLPRGRGYVLAHNLISPIDAFVVALAMAESGHPEPIVMMRASMTGVPFLSRLLKAGALVIGDTGDTDSFTLAERAIYSGRTIVHAPEPVISRSLEIGTLRSDPVRLATATDAPLVACATFGAHRLFDDNRLKLRRGIPVNVTFGSAIPLDGSLNFNPALRMLRMDMEALLGQTLNDYPRKEYGEGSWWWPASRHGGAPTVLEAMGDPQQTASPNAELWADDERVAASRYDRGAAIVSFSEVEDINEPLFLHDAPLGEATWDVVPASQGDEEPGALMFDAEGDGTSEELVELVDHHAASEPAVAEAAISESGLHEPALREVEPEAVHGLFDDHVATATSASPPAPPSPTAPLATPPLAPASAPEPAITGGGLPGLGMSMAPPAASLPDDPPRPRKDNDPSEPGSDDDEVDVIWNAPDDDNATETRASIRQNVKGVSGLLAFDMPGNPRQFMRQITLAATKHDLFIDAAQGPIVLLNVEIDRSGDHSFFWGRLADDHVAVSGDIRVNVPAGTRTSFVAARKHD